MWTDGIAEYPMRVRSLSGIIFSVEVRSFDLRFIMSGVRGDYPVSAKRTALHFRLNGYLL